MSRFTKEENRAIADARYLYRFVGQRQLARLLAMRANTLGCAGYHLRNRSEAAIYSALRRYDATQKAAGRLQEYA